MVSKLEVNIRSLLSSCEELSKDETNFWRLKKYIKSLDTMVDELYENIELTTEKSIEDYRTRLKKLKTTTSYGGSSPTTTKRLPLKKKERANGEEDIREINQIQNAKTYSQLRKELINDDNLRQRNVATEENMEQAMKHYANVQERITEDMLHLTRSLKEQTETASRIIRRDTEIVSKSSQISDKNISSLSKEAEKLQDHSKRAWKCWMWIMIGLVMAIFIFMVLFMKIMKKKT